MEQFEKIAKLKRMKFIATGLLVVMTVVYFMLKKYGPDNFYIGCIIAFSEASMVGALADWFAVTALFKHPMGMKWIPHTAIIQNNKDRLGDSLSSFVMSNFFTEDIIRIKLKNINISKGIYDYIENQKKEISIKVVEYIPVLTESFLNDEQINNRIFPIVKKQIDKIDIYPYAKNILQTFFDDGHHIPIVKQLLTNIYTWVSENREETMKMIESMNKTLTLPFIGEIVYKFIIRSLDRAIDDLEGEPTMEFNRQLLIELPEKFLNNLNNDNNQNDFKELVNKLKNDIISSEKFDMFIIEKIINLRDSISSYCIYSKEELSNKIEIILSDTVKLLSNNENVSNKIDSYIKSGIAKAITSYRNEIGSIISDTVREWPVEDMIEKLEVEVGGDLQYIRINGTIIGGLVGLMIYLVSYFL